MKGVLSMQQIQTASRRVHMRRALSLLLAAVMMLGLVPVFPAAQASAHWADPYLSQLMEWGVINQTQAANPDRALTRADFMGIVNRAYGYETPGVTPFEDVKETDWYYDDVGIAYTARYIKGTSPTTASPKDPLTRETAATILGRNMMLEDSAGEILDFIDARNISTWAKGTIKSSLEHYLVSGYDDGTFRPQRNVSWGEMASMVTRLIGTPLQEPGDYALGGTFGNVTITSPGVTLRDTVVSGDLYITGGVGLGGVQLENVTVLGRIIASGTGTSEGGASILLRNVTADELLVDNLQNNEVSIRADGITEIGNTTVRTSAYIEDNTPEGLGLHMISLEGESYPEGEEPEDWVPAKLTLAGRIEEVVNRTPNSTVHAAKGTVSKLTVDEAAVGSNVIIDRGTVVKDLILDTAVEVTGEGDVTRLEVNSPGCVVEMLPDEIVIRPGITAEIHGEEMDSASADEFRLEPLILSGYPKAKNVAPTTADAVFSTNKKGTIHWAVSAITDGSVGADDLLEPPAYGNIALRYGTLVSPRGNEETIAKIAGLLPDGSYYLSALLEDDRGEISPVKVISFTTPDNTVPAFNQGYPRMFDTSRTNSQAVVSANKSCLMYYVLYPEGATPPTTAELKAGSVTGSLGYGVHELEKNTEFTFKVNDRPLHEQENYVVYFWLTDANGANSSAITSLKFTTADETPPYFLDGYPRVTATGKNNVTLTFRINEDGRVFWVVRPEGDTSFPLPDPETGSTDPSSLYIKTQVASENPAIAAKADTDGKINITGLEPERAYTLYYLCQDNAGNYSLAVETMIIRTEDTIGPHVIGQTFDSFETIGETVQPNVDTGVTLEFSENVCAKGTTDFYSLYQAIDTAVDRDQAISDFVTALKKSITFWKQDKGVFVPADVRDFPWPEDLENEPAWDIDYSQAQVDLDTATGHLFLTFPDGALNLAGGTTYHFVVSDLTDNAQGQKKNPLVDENGNVVASVTLPDFTVRFASVTLTKSPDLTSEDEAPQQRTDDGKKQWEQDSNGNTTTTPILVNQNNSLYFRMMPASTDAVDPQLVFDILLWNKMKVSYRLYYRILNEAEDVVTAEECKEHGLDPLITAAEQKQGDGDPEIDGKGWIYLGNTTCSPRNDWQGASVNRDINNCGNMQFPKLKGTLDDELIYEFIIELTSVNNQDDPTAWSDEVFFRAEVVAGITRNLYNMASNLAANYKKYTEELGLYDGALPISNILEWSVEPQDTKIPIFASETPKFPDAIDNKQTLTDQSVTMQLALDRGNTFIYYLFGKVDKGDGSNTPEIITTVPAEIKVVVVPDTTDPSQMVPKLDENGHVILAENKEDGDQTAKIRNPYGKPGVAPDKDGSIPIDPDKVPLSGAETPDGLPLFPVKLPLADDVFNPENIKSLESNLYGEIPYNGGRVIPYTVGPDIEQELEPNTTYFAYFVLKGKSANAPKSEVYIYKFTTPDTPKPRIQQEPSKGTDSKPAVDGDLDLKTHVAANGEFRAVANSAAQNLIPILKEPFAKYAYTPEELEKVTGGKYKAPTSGGGGGTSPAPQLGTPGCYTKNDTNGVFTVLDALTKRYLQSNAELAPYKSDSDYYVFPETQTGYSVFDYYANESARKLVYDMITSDDDDAKTQARGPLDTKNPNPPEGTPSSNSMYWDKNVAEMGLTPANSERYYNFVFAVNKNAKFKAGEEYKVASFSGYRFGIGKLSPPEVNLATVTLNRDKSTGKYFGTIDVLFKAPTYLYNASGTATPMATDNLLVAPKFVWFKNTPTTNANMTASSVDSAGMSFHIDFSNAIPGVSYFVPGHFTNADNELITENNYLEFRLTESGNTATLKVNWNNTLKGEDSIDISAESQDVDLFFRLPQLNNQYYIANPLTITAVESVEADVTGSPSIMAVTWTSADESIATVAATPPGITQPFKANVTAKGIGETLITLEVVYAGGNGTKIINKSFRVTVTGNITGVTASDPSAFTGSDSTYTWDRGDTKNPSIVLTLAPSGPIGDTCSFSAESSTANVKVTSYSIIKGTPNKATINLQYMGNPGSTAQLIIRLGNITKEITITLKGPSDSGINVSGITKRPY